VPRGTFSVIRETLPALRASAYRDYIEILQQIEIYYNVDHRKTLLEFEYERRIVQFFSTDDLQSAKLRGRQNTFFYLNEANTIPFEAFQQLIIRCEEFCVLDYNPAGIENWCKTYIEDDRYHWPEADVKIDVSTYLDNPYIPNDMIKEIEGLRKTDHDLYQVYTLGNWVQSRNLVFDHINICKTVPQGKVYFGVDFGWNDPSVCVKVTISNKELYIEEVFFRPKMLLKDIAEELLAIGINKVYADNEPRTIKELKNRGLRIKAAKKGVDSIRQGLGFIRTHEIFIHEDSLQTIKEFREYKYALDSELNPTDKPLDFNNHSVDATRYALSYALRGGLRIK